MKGCRPLTDQEVTQVFTTLGTTRDKCLFMIGVSCGYRISEILSLTVKDVFKDGKPLDRAYLAKRNTKNKTEGRANVIGPKVQSTIQQLVEEQGLTEDMPLFTSRKGGAIGRKQAWNILKNAFESCGLQGKLATHSMRKTLAKSVYEKSGKDISATQKALGHRSLSSTTSYLSSDQSTVDAVLLSLDKF